MRNFKGFLQEQGFTQDAAARGIGTTQGTVSELVRRSIDPKWSTVLAVARWARKLKTARGLPPAMQLDIRSLGYIPQKH